MTPLLRTSAALLAACSLASGFAPAVPLSTASTRFSGCSVLQQRPGPTSGRRPAQACRAHHHQQQQPPSMLLMPLGARWCGFGRCDAAAAERASAAPAAAAAPAAVALQQQQQRLHGGRWSVGAAGRARGRMWGEVWRGMALAAAALVAMRRSAHAMHIPSADGALDAIPMEPKELMSRLTLWCVLFSISAALHSAEIAITTLYPWKVKEFAEEEGEKSPFRVLNQDITRVLTTILVATTICSIYSAALFTNLAIQLFGAKGLAYATAALTTVTLFFGELMPKALGVNNAEMVARRMVPIINLMAVFLSPIGKGFSWVSKLVLTLMGFKSTHGDAVSEEELRLIVSGAKQSGGIEREEASMVESVLDLQDTKVTKVMRPRTEVVAIESNSTMASLYTIVNETMYSRIPVFEGAIDRIIGVVLSKELLDFIPDPSQLETVAVRERMEPTYFVPETMPVWNVLEEMRKRRLHMAIVVDEYGGTAGIVTLEDIIEEVVGEIYDEEDDDYTVEENYIIANGDGSFNIHGMADLEQVCTALDFPQVTEDDLRDFGTLSGYLCSQAGEIPAVEDVIMVGRYIFTITLADERRVEEVHVQLIDAANALKDGDDAAPNGSSAQGEAGGEGSDEPKVLDKVAH